MTTVPLDGAMDPEDEADLKAGLGALTGWKILETIEPTSDVSGFDFTTDISAYSRIMIEVTGAASSAADFYGDLMVREAGGAWQYLGYFGQPGSVLANGLVAFLIDVTNVNDADGTHFRRAYTYSYSGTGSYARNDANNASGLDFNFGFIGQDITINEIRLVLGDNTFEGTDATKRTVATLWGML